MHYEIIKTQVKEAFVGVDSEAFLQLKIKEAAEMHAKYFQKYLKEKRNGTLEHWKEITQKSINVFAQNEIMPIGIFLLALDHYINSVTPEFLDHATN